MGCCSVPGLTREEKREALKITLKEGFWAIGTLAISTVIGLIGILIIFIVQLIAFANNAPLNYVAVGIWGSLLILIPKTLNIITIITRSVKWYLIAKKFNLVGIIGCISITITNSVGQRRYPDHPYVWTNKVMTSFATLIAVTNLLSMLVISLVYYKNQKNMLQDKENAAAAAESAKY